MQETVQEKIAVITASGCPESVCRRVPERASQSSAVRSSLAVRMRVPSGETTAELTPGLVALEFHRDLAGFHIEDAGGPVRTGDDDPRPVGCQRTRAEARTSPLRLWTSSPSGPWTWTSPWRKSVLRLTTRRPSSETATDFTSNL